MSISGRLISSHLNFFNRVIPGSTRDFSSLLHCDRHADSASRQGLHS
jgi:hypothetical protein